VPMVIAFNVFKNRRIFRIGVVSKQKRYPACAPVRRPVERAKNEQLKWSCAAADAAVDAADGKCRRADKEAAPGCELVVCLQLLKSP